MSVHDDPVVEYFGGVPITRSQAERMAECSARLREVRARAGYRPLPDAGVSSGVGVNCARCEHCGDFSDEALRGYCLLLRHMVGTWKNCECAAFTVRITPRASDVLKAQLKRQELEAAA